MRAHFNADHLEAGDLDGALAAGVFDRENGHCLMWQRSRPEDKLDDGVYFEWDDQSQGGYELVTSCRGRRDRIEVDLGQTFDGFDGIDVDLRVVDDLYAAFVKQLIAIHRERRGVLVVS